MGIGAIVGEVGEVEGALVGICVGIKDKWCIGLFVGTDVECIGRGDGARLGLDDGALEGRDGRGEGNRVGLGDGMRVG